MCKWGIKTEMKTEKFGACIVNLLVCVYRILLTEKKG